MTKIIYEIVEHDGGWAYRVNGVFSETFPSHDTAREAAERAAGEQAVPGDTTAISYEDKDGRWHDELSAGNDRPETDVEAMLNPQDGLECQELLIYDRPMPGSRPAVPLSDPGRGP